MAALAVCAATFMALADSAKKAGDFGTALRAYERASGFRDMEPVAEETCVSEPELSLRGCMYAVEETLERTSTVRERLGRLHAMLADVSCDLVCACAGVEGDREQGKASCVDPLLPDDVFSLLDGLEALSMVLSRRAGVLRSRL